MRVGSKFIKLRLKLIERALKPLGFLLESQSKMRLIPVGVRHLVAQQAGVGRQVDVDSGQSRQVDEMSAADELRDIFLAGLKVDAPQPDIRRSFLDGKDDQPRNRGREPHPAGIALKNGLARIANDS